MDGKFILFTLGVTHFKTASPYPFHDNFHIIYIDDEIFAVLRFRQGWKGKHKHDNPDNLCSTQVRSPCTQCQVKQSQPCQRKGVNIQIESAVDVIVQPCGTKYVRGQNAEINDQHPQQNPVVPCPLVLKPKRKGIARQCNQICMCFRAIAEKDDKAHQHCQHLDAETKIPPSSVITKESHQQETECDQLNQTIIGKKKRLESRCKQYADKVGVAVMVGYHVEHALVHCRGPL